ncbi:uncharacterized protein J8A68_002911 [[Candida] subhashii]|uniref:Protein kinase domain-containing protein n=1 Tax=[Candida] subhashii TaxID=561895 RepID=A0A8J5UN97_9ASCO|nr:uncharacterized protein J8A68_002911 [[Candida] subhashii]KAG7663527.1 hypothetical protein J8A68_002911 [[Candida] subhashii]
MKTSKQTLPPPPPSTTTTPTNGAITHNHHHPIPLYNNPVSPNVKRMNNKELRIHVPASSTTVPSSDNEIPSLHNHHHRIAQALGEPVRFAKTTTISPSSINFDRISHLPTPVVNSGSFFNYSHANESSLLRDSARLAISSRDNDLEDEEPSSASPLSSPNRNILHSKSPPPRASAASPTHRVISDYRPLGRNNSLLEKSNISRVNHRRHISNPISFQESASIPSTSSSTATTTTNVTNPSTVVINTDGGVESPITPSGSPISPSSSKYFQRRFYSPRLNRTFDFVREIGTGNFSTVVLGRLKEIVLDDDYEEGEGEVEAAIKIITVPVESRTQIFNFKAFIRRELNLLCHISYHPCITSLIDYSITMNISDEEIQQELIEEHEENPVITLDDEEIYQVSRNNQQLIFMNYCPGGNLLNFLLEYKQSSHLRNVSYWILLKRIICEIMVTIAFLHKKDIVHRDIKLENILLLYTPEEIDQLIEYNQLTNTPLINISDFGLSKKLGYKDQLLSTRCGSQDYISPEILMGLKYDGKLTDTWSIGVLIFSILENRLPFDLPPMDSPGAGCVGKVSPSVIKRKRSRNNVAHRIAMIDWDWYRIHQYLADDNIPAEVKVIFGQLKSIVDVVLVRKDRRINCGQLLEREEFQWIKDYLPDGIVNVP